MSVTESSAQTTGAPLPDRLPLTVILVRHGPVEDGGICYGARTSPPLSAAAPSRIRHLQSRLPSMVGRVVASPATRCQETARLLGFSDVETDAVWLERDFGNWEGRPWSDVWAELGHVDDADTFADFSPEGGEPWTDVRARAAAALTALAASDPPADGAPIVVVTHAGVIRTVLSHVLGIGIGTSLLFDPAPASATWLTSWGDTWTIARMGA
ncbi:MAG: alpha-ribazole phosphatase [Glaciecola sp.]|jgi:alpha-ribazole phosphatase